MENTDIKKINIKSLIEKETGLKFTKNNLEKCCFCNSGDGTNKSSAFSIKPNENIFKCFSCEKSGNPIDFIKNYKGISSNEAILYLTKQHSTMEIVKNEPIKKDIESLSKTIFAIKQNNKSNATEYLKQRFINTDLLKNETYYYDKIENAIVFFDSVEHLANKRLIAPKEKQSKSKFVKDSTIVNSIYDKCFNSNCDTVFLTEGIINGFSLLPNSFISIFTTTNKFTEVEKFKKYFNDKNVVIAFDNDNAGNDCAKYYKDFILNNFQVKSLKQLLFPENIDANDLLKTKELEKYICELNNYKIFKTDIFNEPIQQIEQDKDNERNFFSKEHKYFKTEITKKGNLQKTNISNFDMQILYHLKDGTNDTKRILKVQRHTGEIVLFDVLSSNLSGEKFKIILRSISDKGLSFLGTVNDLETILTYLYDFEKTAIPLYDEGYYSEHNIFSFSNLIINQNNEIVKPNEIGILTDSQKCFFLSKTFEKLKPNNVNDFEYKEGTINFNEYSDLIYKAYGVDGIIGLCFFINTLFRDFIFNVTGRFPFLYLYGEAGTGKTSFVNILRSPYNRNDVGHPLTSTNKSLGRLVQQYENYMVYFKEYSNNIDREILELLKTSYDGASYSRAKMSNDNSIIAGKCKSSIILDGNSLPTYEAAIYDRIILLDFDNSKFTETQHKAFAQLKSEIEKGTSQIIKEVIKHRKTFTNNFQNAYNEIFETINKSDKEFNGTKIKDIRTRTIEHTAFILATYKIFSKLFDFPIEYSEISTKIIEYAIEKELTIEIIKPISIFWKAIDFNIGLNNSNISCQNLRIDENYVYIKFDYLYPFYVKYCKENSIKYEDNSGLKKTLISKNNLSFVAGNRKGNNNNASSHTVNGFGSCYRFTYEKINEQIIVNNVEMNNKISNYNI